MAYVKMSIAEARVRAQVDPQRLAATTESEIRGHMLEDGFNPDEPLDGLREIVGIEAVRVRTGMSLAQFAGVLGIPASVLKHWESGAQLDPVATALFALVDDDPDRAMRILSAKRSARHRRPSPDPAGSSS